MYAVINSGSKQLRVETGQTVVVDRLHVPVGETMALNGVLLLSGDDTPVMVGAPRVAGAMVKAKVVEHRLGHKQVGLRYKPKKRHRVKKGQRAAVTRLQITEIGFRPEGS